MKVIKIKWCDECPNMSTYFDNKKAKYVNFCMADGEHNKVISLNDRFTIPDWCPLEDLNKENKYKWAWEEMYELMENERMKQILDSMDDILEMANEETPK